MSFPEQSEPAALHLNHKHIFFNKAKNTKRIKVLLFLKQYKSPAVFRDAASVDPQSSRIWQTPKVFFFFLKSTSISWRHLLSSNMQSVEFQALSSVYNLTALPAEGH